jgi:hypothetical protein
VSTQPFDDNQRSGASQWRDPRSPRVGRILLIGGGATLGVIVLAWLIFSLLYPRVTSVVAVSTRPSLLVDRTAVLQLRNTSNQAVTGVIVEFRNRAQGKSGVSDVGVIAAGETTELGILQRSWILQADEEFTVRANGYRGASFYTYANDRGEVFLSP